MTPEFPFSIDSEVAREWSDTKSNADIEADKKLGKSDRSEPRKDLSPALSRESGSPEAQVHSYDLILSEMSLAVFDVLQQDYGIYESTVEVVEARYTALKGDVNSYKGAEDDSAQIGYLSRLESYIHFLKRIEGVRSQLHAVPLEGSLKRKYILDEVAGEIQSLDQKLKKGTYFSSEKGTRTFEDEMWE